ncbi:MAG: NAD(P)H-dependent oxidoreductase [Acidobacteriota bacterium]
MIVVISGSNRPGNNSSIVAKSLRAMAADAGEETFPVDLEALPTELFTPAAYAEKPASFEKIQEAILAADGILTVVPEYNGSYPGALKYFIDCLRFPESLVAKPSAFVGVAAGKWGGMRAVEQLEMVFQYRHAHLYGRRVFLDGIFGSITDGRLTDDEALRRMQELIDGFVPFCRALRD